MVKIPLTQGKFAIVDIEDYEWLSQYKWFAKKIDSYGTYYAARSQKIKGTKQVKTIYMHREIANCPQGKEVDHKNKNTLDNRRDNLENVTRQENMARQKKQKI